MREKPSPPLTVLAADKGGLGKGDSASAPSRSFDTFSLVASTRMAGGRGNAATSVEKTAASSAVSDSASEVTEAREVVVVVEMERGRVREVRIERIVRDWAAKETWDGEAASGESFEVGPLILLAFPSAPPPRSSTSCTREGLSTLPSAPAAAFPPLRDPSTHSAFSLSRSRALLCGLAAWSTSPVR